MGSEGKSELAERQSHMLASVERNVRSARNILFSINIICGFLLITIVFDIFFGWQKMRPAASHFMFIENVARLASLKQHQNSDGEFFSPYSEGIIEIARKRVARMIAAARSIAYCETRDSRYRAICDSLETWDREDIEERLQSITPKMRTLEKEEHLALFVKAVDEYEQRLKKVPPDKSVAGRDTISCYVTGQLGNDSVHLQTETVRVGAGKSGVAVDSVKVNVAFINALMPLDTEVSHAMLEIRDRYQVNEDTRGRKRQPRIYEMPVIGVDVQLEDVSLPVTLFLLFLTLWLSAGVRKFAESVYICYDYFPPDARASASEPPKKAEFAKLMTNAFYFFDWCELEEKRVHYIRYNNKIVILLAMPYITVASSIIANLYEFVYLDLQLHGSDYSLLSSMTEADVFLKFMTCAATAYIAVSAWRSSTRLDRLYVFLTRQLPTGFHTAFPLLRSRCMFCWALCAPFIIFGTYVALQHSSESYRNEYFLIPWYNLFAYGVVLGIAFATLCVLNRKLFKHLLLGRDLTSSVCVFIPILAFAVFGLSSKTTMGYPTLSTSIFIAYIVALVIIGVWFNPPELRKFYRSSPPQA